MANLEGLPMEHFTNDYSNDSRFSEPSGLISAYQSLLENREKDLFVSDLETSLVSEDDALCNRNLQTATLLKNLNEKYLDQTKQLDTLNQDEQDIYKCVQNLEKTFATVKALCSKYSRKSFLTFDALSEPLRKEFLEIETLVKQDIEIKRIKVDTDLENTCRKQNALRKLVQAAIGDMVKPEDITKKMCPICFDREVMIAMIPCGHTFCQGCSNSAVQSEYRSKCPQCRQQINGKVKIFFSV